MNPLLILRHDNDDDDCETVCGCLKWHKQEEVAMCSGSFCSREVERFRQEAEKLIASERIQLQV